MKLRKTVYLFHRWLGLLVCLQLIAWSAGGLVFSVLDIRNVRGEQDVAAAVDSLPPLSSAAVAPADARRLADDAGVAVDDLTMMTLRDRGLGARYELYDLTGHPVCAVDVITGEVVTRIPRDEAARLALADFTLDATVRSTSLIEHEAAGEFRGKRTPAWRVDLDHPKEPHIYIDAVTGEVLARRNRIWRVFDFFWMLHIMDYKNRENFNHPVLAGFSSLALMTGATGVWLWGWRARGWRRRRTARSGKVVLDG